MEEFQFRQFSMPASPKKDLLLKRGQNGHFRAWRNPTKDGQFPNGLCPTFFVTSTAFEAFCKLHQERKFQIRLRIVANSATAILHQAAENRTT